LKQLRAEKESKQVRIEEAVALYIADMIARLGDNGTVAMARSLFGHVDPDTKAVERNGRLFDWLDKQTPRPVFIADLTPAHLTTWRTTWKFNDQTARQRWGMVRGFFNFCEAQGWIGDSPARKLKSPAVSKANRTGVFSDEQYAAIIDAISRFEPAENVPAQNRAAWQQRLLTFVELLRWSGMALIDAVQFRSDMVDAEGVLRYSRHKSGELATVQLPEHLVALLRSIPLEAHSDSQQPFRTANAAANSDTRKWQHRLETLFALAEIKAVATPAGPCKPHAHLFRHTFAVWHLRHGAKLHSVARMLGHSKTTTTEQSYLPWVKELEQATIEDGRKALAQLPQQKPGKKVVSIA
jgi:integrase/recombinase XerD